MQQTQENITKLVEDNEKSSQKEQKNTEDEEINGLFLVHESRKNYGIDLKEEAICDETGENVNTFPELYNFGFVTKIFPTKVIILLTRMRNTSHAPYVGSHVLINPI